MLHAFFSSLTRSKLLLIFSLSSVFTQCFPITAKSTRLKFIFLIILFIYTVTGLLDWIRSSVSVSVAENFIGYIFLDWIWSMWVYNTIGDRWLLTGVWATPILFKSPGLFSIHWPILIVQEFRKVSLVHLFSSSPMLATILSSLYQENQWQLESQQLLYDKFFFSIIKQGLHTRSTYS